MSFHTFSFHTSDPFIARKIHTILSGDETKPAAGAAPAKAVAATPLPAAPVAAALSPLAAAPTPTPTPTPPAATPTPPATTQAAPAPTPASPAADGLDDIDKAALAAGWTVEHVKQAATAYVQKHGAEGPSGVKAILQQHGADRVVGKGALAPKHFQSVYHQLNAA